MSYLLLDKLYVCKAVDQNVSLMFWKAIAIFANSWSKIVKTFCKTSITAIHKSPMDHVNRDFWSQSSVMQWSVFWWSNFLQEVGWVPLQASFRLKQEFGATCHTNLLYRVQGDPTGCFPVFVDIKTKVAFQYMLLTLKRNFCFDVNNTWGTTMVSNFWDLLYWQLLSVTGSKFMVTSKIAVKIKVWYGTPKMPLQPIFLCYFSWIECSKHNPMAYRENGSNGIMVCQIQAQKDKF